MAEWPGTGAGAGGGESPYGKKGNVRQLKLFSGSTAEIQRSALEKLKELGWAEEIQKISVNYYLSQSFNQHLAVAQNQKKGLTDESKLLLFDWRRWQLTYQAWLSIRWPIINFLEETKNQRLEAERKAERKKMYAISIPILMFFETIIFTSAMDKLRALGWGEEMDKLRNSYTLNEKLQAVENHEGVLTDEGGRFVVYAHSG